MDDSSTIPGLLGRLAAVMLVLANGFFVAAEFALVGLRRSRIEALAANGNRNARRVLGCSTTPTPTSRRRSSAPWLRSPSAGSASLRSRACSRGRSRAGSPDTARHTIAFAVAFTIITALHIVLGEQASSSSDSSAERVALAVAWPMEPSTAFFSWPIRALDWASARTVTLLGLKASPAHASAHTAEELRQLIDLSHRGGQLKPSQRAILSRALEFSGLTARDMVPRPAVEAVAENMSLDEIVTRIRESGYSRLPVYRESLDEIVGIIHTKELLAFWDNREGFASPPCSTRPTSSPTPCASTSSSGACRRAAATTSPSSPTSTAGRGCDHARRFARRDRRRDSGRVRRRGAAARPPPPGRHHLLDGSLPVRSANRRLGLGLPEDGVYHTLAGFLYGAVRAGAQRGDTVTFGGGRVHRPQSDRHRIRTVRMEVAAANVTAASEDAESANRGNNPSRVSVSADSASSA